MENRMLKGFAVAIISLVIWGLLPSSHFISAWFAFNSALVVDDFVNFNVGQTKIRHYILGAIISPFWLFVRFFVVNKKS